METRVIASTKEGHVSAKEEMLSLGGRSAGICYMPESYEALENEPKVVTQKRVEGTIGSGHHSVYDHSKITFVFSGISKIVAMILNNEKDYATSEKSARYTVMQMTPEEKIKYDKWLDIYRIRIKMKCPDFSNSKIEKLAQENARYLTSVFTPTVLQYTVSLRQLNYIVYMMQEFVERRTIDVSQYSKKFYERVKKDLIEFIASIKELGYIIPGLECSSKNRKLSLFAPRERIESFGDVYSVNYKVSLACFAQLQRHRTLNYEFILSEGDYYVPPIIREDCDLVEEWLGDISSNQDSFPQGMLVFVNERGSLEDFVLKSYERLCYEAQLEIMQNTYETAHKFFRWALDNDYLGEIIDMLRPLRLSAARCNFVGFKCSNPCDLNLRQFTRII